MRLHIITKTSYSYRQVSTSKDFTYTRALFNLFRNVMNYRNLRECTLQVSHVSVICCRGTHSELSRTALLCCRLALLAITNYIYNQSEKELILKRKTGLAYFPCTNCLY